jgi:SAM-dependent methyltransferase
MRSMLGGCSDVQIPVDWNRPLADPAGRLVWHTDSESTIPKWGLAVHRELTERLCCTQCRGPLSLEIQTLQHGRGHVDRGELHCAGCDLRFPIVRGIPRFVPSEGYVASFGRQWTRYAVERLEEDEPTFQVKTDFQWTELAGQTVLDAGCGGGRYSYVAARHGARLIAVDMSRAIDRAAAMCREFEHVDFIQADLLTLPIAEQAVDRAFSIGVLHHSSDAHAAFQRVASTVRTGGRLAVWLYRRNTRLQEAVNEIARGVTRRMTTGQLEAIAVAGAVLGSMPLVDRVANKLINFSSHPVWNNRVCDTFDWYSPQFQSHHTIAELGEWFQSAGFSELRELSPEKQGSLYRWAYAHNLLIGSGVNIAGTKTAASNPQNESAHYTSTARHVNRMPDTSSSQSV